MESLDWDLESFLHSLPSEYLQIKDARQRLQKHTLAGRYIHSLPITGLHFFTALRFLDLSNNSIEDCRPLAAIPALAHLNLANNCIGDVSPLSALHKTLTVLNLSAQRPFDTRTRGRDDSAIATSPLVTLSALFARRGRAAAPFVSLKALIVNDNNLEALGSAGGPGADRCLIPTLETLVVSRNARLGGIRPGEGEQADLWACVAAVGSTLRKLSASGCGIGPALPSGLDLPLLNELRLSQNVIEAIPQTVRLKSLHILDVSGNRLPTLDALSRFPFLTQLSVHGNPCAPAGGDDTALRERDQFLAACFPDMKFLDGHAFSPMESVSNEQRTAIRGRLRHRLLGPLSDPLRRRPRSGSSGDASGAVPSACDDESRIGHGAATEQEVARARSHALTRTEELARLDEAVDAADFVAGAGASSARDVAAAKPLVRTVKHAASRSASGGKLGRAVVGQDAAAALVASALAAKRGFDSW